MSDTSLTTLSVPVDDDGKSENNDGVEVVGTHIAMCADKTVLLTPMGDVLVSMAQIMIPNLSTQLLADSSVARDIAHSALASTTRGTMRNPTGSVSAISTTLRNSPSRSEEDVDKCCLDSCCQSIVAAATQLRSENHEICNDNFPQSSSLDWARVAIEFIASHFNQAGFQSSSSKTASCVSATTNVVDFKNITDSNSRSALLIGGTYPSQDAGGLLGGQEDFCNNASPTSIDQENAPNNEKDFPQPNFYSAPARIPVTASPQTPNHLINSLLNTSVSFEETKEDLYCSTCETDSTTDMRNSAIVLNENYEANEPGPTEIGLSSFDLVDSTLMETVPSFDYSHLESDMSQIAQLVPSAKKPSQSVTYLGIKGVNVPLENQVITSSVVSKNQFKEFKDESRSKKKTLKLDDKSSIPFVTEGIPMFLPSLAQVKVTKISANPLGAHVLFISDSALLFSYGSNKFGQLGLGHRKDTEHPEVVISLLEGGGKALDCAAGAAHSLVVVRTCVERTQRHARKLSVHSSGSETDDESITPSNKNGSSEADMSFGNKTRILDHDCITHSKFSAGDGMRTSWNNGGKTLSPKSLNTPEMACNSDSNQYDPISIHQVYGFGQNTYYKLGLIQPSDTEDILLPRRVGLNCEIWQDADMASSSTHNDVKDSTAFGVFNLVASSHHSAALVRRTNGATELYTWGYAGDGALGHYFNDKNTIKRISVRNPTLVERLSQRGGSSPSSTCAEKSRINPTHEESLENCIGSDIPKSIAVGNRCTILLTAQGRCVTFGCCDSGVLGLGDRITESFDPTFLKFKHPHKSESIPILTSVNIGSTHAVAISSEGHVFTWGSNDYGELGFNPNENKSSDKTVWSPRYLSFDHSEIYCRPHSCFFPRKTFKKPSKGVNQRNVRSRSASPSRGKLTLEAEHLRSPPKFNLTDPSIRSDSMQTVSVCAGLDATVFVMRSGEVLSCGRSSGRLGQGECLSDVIKPTPLYGGLHLWHLH